jgi:uncharacterized spore protein YtfJ
MQEKTSMEEIVRDIVDAIEHEGNVKAIFGEAVELDTHRIVPVARAKVNVGGGGGFGGAMERLQKAAEKFVPAAGGGGGGLDIVIEPVGFISERDGEVMFTRIDAGEKEDQDG